jgi:uncharacterized protein with HEPN domain
MDTLDRVRLQHMLEAAQEALSFAKGKTRADLDSDRLLAHALVECLRVTGEAARQVSSETRQEYPAIPWRDAIGMRNQLVHEYFKIDYDIVWQTVREDLPALVQALEQEGL